MNKIKSFFRWKTAAVAVIISLLAFSFISFTAPGQRYFLIAKNMEIFASVFGEINRYYVDEVDPSKLMKTGIDAMLESLDPYTNYIPEDEIEDFRFVSTGQYGGIGAMIGNREKKVLVLMPYEGFPAHKAGLKIGDEIVEIDGKNAEGKNTNEISKMLKGQAGTKVNVKVKRFGNEKLLPIEITREKITVKNVPYYGMIGSDVGYFKLSNFTSDATKEVRKAMSELKDQGATKFIFDLRGNTGGLLKEAIGISNLFVEKGKEIVSTKGKVEKWNAVHHASDQPYDLQSPIVVLINGKSASASEIVSGVIQDYDRGILIGSKTFGKGLVQATLQTAYNSQVKVTTAKYYIPSGRCIQAIDYSNRDDEGVANKIADSLLVPFKTMGGRVVFDGEGITPDIASKRPTYSPLLLALVRGNYIFDFATEYAHTHKTIPEARKFKLTDQEYAEFATWLSKKDFTFQVAAERHLEDFVKNNEKDTTRVEVDFTAEIEAIRTKIERSKKDELMNERSTVKEYLEQEICSRYYFEKGTIEASFDDDVDIQQALRLFSDKSKYLEVLTAKKE